MATGAIIARIVSEYSDKGTKAATKDLQSVGKEFDAFGGKVKKAFEVAAVASAAFAVKIGIDSVKAALADQKSQALLASSLKNTTGANQAAIKSADDYIKKTMLRLGVTDDELRPSLAALATATHSVTEAEKLQGLALDISAGRNKDLTQVSIALAKAYDGNFTAVKRLGIPISEALIKSKDFTGILKELSAAVHDQATVAADTLAGRMDRVKLAFDEAKKSLGYALMPVIQDFLSTLTDQVLPKLQLWIDANKDKLAAGLKTAATALGSLLKNGIAFGEWITSHMTLVKDFAAVIAIMWTTTKVAAFVGAINTVITAMRLLTATSVAASIAEAFATGGVSVAAGTIAAVTLTAAYATYNVATNWSKVKDKTDAAAASANDYYSRSKAAVVEQAVADQLDIDPELVTVTSVTTNDEGHVVVVYVVQGVEPEDMEDMQQQMESGDMADAIGDNLQDAGFKGADVEPADAAPATVEVTEVPVIESEQPVSGVSLDQAQSEEFQDAFEEGVAGKLGLGKDEVEVTGVEKNEDGDVVVTYQITGGVEKV